MKYLPLIALFLIILTGCTSFEERFLEQEDESDKRVFSNDLLAKPASMQTPLALPDVTELPRTKRATVELGFFSDNFKHTVTASGIDTHDDYDNLDPKKTLFCKGDNGYTYTLGLESPTAEVDGYASIGMRIEIIDNQGVSIDELSCPISIIDVNTKHAVRETEFLVKLI
jgi:hypothetical protein